MTGRLSLGSGNLLDFRNDLPVDALLKLADGCERFQQ
jgi:hypothetical protein